MEHLTAPSLSGNSSFAANPVAAGHLLLFTVADRRSDKVELWKLESWKSDGTRRGTVLVKDISRHSPNLGFGSETYDAVSANGLLLFAAGHPSYGHELWKSDGTTEGTTVVKDIYPGGKSSFPNTLVNANGSAAGTTLVMPTSPPSGPPRPQHLININRTVFWLGSP